MSLLIKLGIIVPLAVVLYAYVVYPLLLVIVAAVRRRRLASADPQQWPFLTITVPCYNEGHTIAKTLEALLALDYPADRRQIVVLSDASTDDTDDIVRTFADRGVELVRLATRRGKSAAENAAASVARGDIIVNLDATIRVAPGALKALVRTFQDPTVGVASGRDVSVATTGGTIAGESRYVGYEMAIRSLETRVDSIVGASGCFYGIRRTLYDGTFPETLSRDFASALVAREHGYRAVSVEDALCYVPRASKARAELQRKIRTMARGLATLWYKRHLMNPFRYGVFAILLVSHKLCRWLVYPLLPIAAIALVAAAGNGLVYAIIAGLILLGTVLGIIGLRWPQTSRAPALIAFAAYILAATLAGVVAWKRVLMRQHAAAWEPTRRIA
jgi:cellulose synthase/poly-beta-1,6-N-acetylglucosamine synthase-like glycosyltransferase